MLASTATLLSLVVATIANLIMLKYLSKEKKKNQLIKLFIISICILLFWLVVLILQLLLAIPLGIKPIYFDYFIYISVCFIPIVVYLMGLSYRYSKIKFSKKTILLFIVPIISLLVLWTNDFHHLFFVKYSTNMAEGVSGPFMKIHNIYSYTLLGIGIINILIFSIKNAGLFSKQSMLILLGIMVPLSVNILGTLKIISINIYLTPITFTITIICFAIAILKFRFTGAAPVALRKIVNQISDSYIVLNEQNQITDCNNTFLNTFKVMDVTRIIGFDFQDVITRNKIYLNYNQIIKIIDEIKDSEKTKSFELYVKNLKKYFNTEISSIMSNDQYLGTLVLFKDITQHKKDIETIKNNQSILMEKERLATLGAMIGGVAHNLKTPIMSIAGATEGLEDLVNEYKNSVGDPEVTVDDHHAIANDMMEWVTKIRSYDGYMSDIITAVKGQAVNMNENQDESFTVDELLSRVNILMKHELKNGQVALNEDVSIDNTVKFAGNVNSLVQVINNLISNAIQAYPPIDPADITAATGSSFIKGNGADNGSGKSIGQKISNITTSRTIDLIISSKDDKILIQVVDHASGMPDEVKSKLFKEMITTKGHNGSGLGLFMSFSTIKGNFHGDMTFESELGKGTTFNITLPRK